MVGQGDRPNLWGDVPSVIEMQSEGGAAGAVHGAPPGRIADDDLHGVAGPAADAPGHVQDCRRADAVRHARLTFLQFRESWRVSKNVDDAIIYSISTDFVRN